MTAKDAFQKVRSELAPQVGEREASSIAKYLLEDTYSIYSTTSLQEVDSQLLESQLLDLLAGKPLAQVTGIAYFYNLRLRVNEHVLIPRPETEELVEWAIQWIRARDIRSPNILDIGTGSGCIALALAKELPEAKVWAVDCSEAALGVAQKNALELKLAVTFSEEDVLQPTFWQNKPKMDLIISNPPYIPPSEKSVMPNSVLNYEPEMALFTPEEDPMLFYRQIAQSGQHILNSNGGILVEGNEFRMEDVISTFKKAGYADVELREDLQGKPRMLLATKA